MQFVMCMMSICCLQCLCCTAGDGGSTTGILAAASGDTALADDWAQADTLNRVEACLQKRFQLAGCSLVEGLTIIPATCQANWDDMTLSSLLYRS
jgi:hypothetical protein